jgi:hypothetical protein
VQVRGKVSSLKTTVISEVLCPGAVTMGRVFTGGRPTKDLRCFAPRFDVAGGFRSKGRGVT